MPKEETKEETLTRIKARIDARINDLLCDTKPNYDDSIVGINDAWDIVRKVMEDEIRLAKIGM